MKGKLIQSLINQFPLQHQDQIMKSLVIIGYDRIVKKGFLSGGQPRIHEITEYASNSLYYKDKIRMKGRLGEDAPVKIRQELDSLREEIQKLNNYIQPQDDRKRSSSMGTRRQKEITPKITEIVPQILQQNINIHIAKHHLDDTEIKSVMRDNFHKEKPPRPKQQTLSSENYRKTDEQLTVDFEETDRPVPQIINYSQTATQPKTESKIPLKQLIATKSTQVTSDLKKKSPPHRSPKFKYQKAHSTNSSKSMKEQIHHQQQVSVPQHSQTQQFSLHQPQKKLDTVQEESINKKMSTHSASSKGRQSYTPPQGVSKIKDILDQDKRIHNMKQQNSFDRQLINPYDQPILTVDKYEQDDAFTLQQKQCSNNSSYFNNSQMPLSHLSSSYNPKLEKSSSYSSLHEQYQQQYQQQQLEQLQIQQQRNQKVDPHQQSFQQQSFQQPQNSYPSIKASNEVNDSQRSFKSREDSILQQKQKNLQYQLLQQQLREQTQLIQQQLSSQSTRRQYNQTMFTRNDTVEDIQIPLKSQQNQQRPYFEKKEVQFVSTPPTKLQYSPPSKFERPSSLGSELKKSDQFNRSSVSSTFSMFNPNDELKNFFQNDFMERKKNIPSNDLTKQSSASFYDSNHQSKYITASQIEDYPRNIRPESMEKQSNVFQNNRLSVTRILNNSQL